uniref:MABP1/WDR62 second WD40 domain-containing protein n=1 Tax=Glossina brevipalpis TaxID=37001 RepID=A0A1A9WKM8_9MUSC
MFAPRNSSPVRVYGKEDIIAYEIKLKKVLGLTVCSNAALGCSSISGLLAYPAGCTIVLFNAKKQTQAYLVNTSRKAFTSVAFSRCGRYIATGECGINPAIKVWELDAPNGNLANCTGGNVIAEFVDHKYAVTCVAFSPTGKYLVSVGSQHDMIVNVFDWKANLKMASNKISSKVSAISFAEDGSYFVTVGNRHVKYWYLEGGRKYKDPIPLMGRSAILGDLRDNDFCAVACGKGVCAESTYAITRQGHLVEFSSRRLLDKWVQCRTTHANCISVNGQFILVGCAEAIIRIFNASTLEYVTTLPRTHYLGVDVAEGIHINHIMTVPSQAKYPDCIAMAFDEQRSKITCVYNDHSLYIWDMRDIKRVGKSHSFLYHSTCIWGVETVPYNMERDISHTLPDDSFVTCSSDDTIRVWGLEECANNEIYRKNIYSKELLKIIYIDNDLNYIKDPEIFNDKNNVGINSNYDGRNGVRCIKISPELQHLASGDRSGNIRVYDLTNLKLIITIEAHESEVLCLEYSNENIDRKLLASASRDRLIHVFDVVQNYRLLQTLDDHSSSITSIKFVGTGFNFQMISCGADKSIMFRTFQGNIFLRGSHTSGKTTLYDMEVDSNSKHILTACQDRNIRVYGTQNSKHTKTFKGSYSDEGSLIKLSLDPSGIYVATSCTDKTLAVYDYYSNECMARMSGHSELVTGLKFTNDCRYLISASGDGCIFIWQVPHDMIVTMQARLSQQRLRSGHTTSVPKLIATSAQEGAVTNSYNIDLEDTNISPKFANSPDFLAGELPLTPGYKLSDVGQLPQWAKKKAGTSSEMESSGTGVPFSKSESNSNLNSSSSLTSLAPRPRNRWAQRGGQFDADTLTDIRSNSESPLGSTTTAMGILPSINVGGLISTTQTSDYNSASSKDIMYNQMYFSEDSSLDSGMENRRDLKFVGSSNVGTAPSNSNAFGNNGSGLPKLLQEKRKSGVRFDNISTNDHDGDIEDISDGERTSSDHGLFYNNISPSTPTDFKVTAMNEEELRKSVRRQKFEKIGLSISANCSSHTASTGTGTGTSDTEDEGSTPSAEHADRSLASTLGGSSESIPLASSTFLQAALPDVPCALLERGSTGRRSISAKHNTENNKSIPVQPTITKSYTTTKKEELLKVINEAKQKLENVGYRSLRGSHSISDLSLAADFEGPRTSATANRFLKTATNSSDFTHFTSTTAGTAKKNVPLFSSPQRFNQNDNYFPPHQQFFNCAAPKSVLHQNCQVMRQVQRHYPPYPRHVGVYQIHPPPGVPLGPIANKSVQQKLFTNSTLPTSNQGNGQKRNNRRTTSILKHYKSCPVSPVHEEVEWSATTNKSITTIAEPKLHSTYAEDARTIFDIISSDTEKMIEEIAKKYGDLDDIGTNVDDPSATSKRSQLVVSKSVPANLADARSDGSEKGNSSHNSIHHHQPQQPYVAVAPKHAFSEFYVYQEIYRCQRKVSLSDILNESSKDMTEFDGLEEARFLEAQRHSSASFFLSSQNPLTIDRSQESLLSEDFMDDVSYCNSMESILSDESDCKSAPVDTLVEKQKIPKHASLRNFIVHGPSSSMAAAQMISRSYGGSPNTYSSFDYYIQQHHLQSGSSKTYNTFDMSNYSMDKIKAVDKKIISSTTNNVNSETYRKFNETKDYHKINDDNIPTLSSKNRQYSSTVSKSISSDFAQQRWQNNTNPIKTDTFSSGRSAKQSKENMFERKIVKGKPPVPTKPHNLISTLTSAEANKHDAGVEVYKKTCSFRADGHVATGTRCNSRTASVVRKFEKNLQKFEREKQAEMLQAKKKSGLTESASSGALTTATQSCLKKISKFDQNDQGPASRRATSMKHRDRPKISVRFNTVSQIKYTPNTKRSSSCIKSTTEKISAIDTDTLPIMAVSLPSDYGEKAFEMFISGSGNDDHGNMNIDNFKLYTKPKLQAVVDEIKQKRGRDTKYKKNLANVEKSQTLCSRPTIIDSSTTKQCNSINKKIDVIQKLIEMEERKLEQIRLATESRMQPFECDSKQKGYVKSLTMNFDMLAKGIETDIENGRRRILNDNMDADLCAYARHIKRNCSLPDVLENTGSYNVDEDSKSSQFIKVDDDGIEVELAKEVKADSDVDNEDEKEDESEKAPYSNKVYSSGNGKSVLPAPTEESSSIRRACSLSDLYMGNVSKGGKTNNFTQKSGGTPHRNSSATRNANKRNIQQKASPNNLGSNTTMGILNPQTDSEPEDNNHGRILSASQGKSMGSFGSTRSHANKNSNSNNSRRKSGIQMNFNNDDSSSEEAHGSSSNAKPVVPPRPRNLSFDHKTKTQSNCNVVKQRGVFEIEEHLDLSGCTDPKSQVHNVINKLYSTTQTVLQLHANLRNCEDSLMLKELENAVIMTQNMLTNITQTKTDKNNQHANHSFTTTEQKNLENGDYLMMVNNCSDMLTNFRMKHKPDNCESNS